MLASNLVFRSFLGRSDDIAHLLARRREAAAARGGLVLVSGEAGLGKSRLLSELHIALRGTNTRVAVTQCRESASRPYEPIVDLLERLGKNLEPGATSRDEQFAHIQSEIRELCKRRCLVVAIEDLHWANSDTLELIEAVARNSSATRLLVIGTYRPDTLTEGSPAFNALARLHRQARASHIALQPLSRADVAKLVDEVLADAALEPKVRRDIITSSEGNPFFAEELLKSAVLVSQRGASSKDLTIALRAVLQQRFALLDEESRNVLAQAAVFGRHFSLPMLISALGVHETQALRALRAARDLQLILEDEEGQFSFRHALTREAIYATLLETEARDYHRRVAVALESSPESDRLVVDLAYHWWGAHDAAKSFYYGIAAAEQAMKVFAHEDAIRAYEYALAFIDRHSPMAAQALMNLGYSYGRIGANATAGEVFSDAVLAFREAGDLAGECEARIELSACRHNVGQDPFGPLEEVRPQLLAREHRVLQQRVDVALAQLYILRRDFQKGAALLDGVRPNATAHSGQTLITYHAMRAVLAACDCDEHAFLSSVHAADRIGERFGLAFERATILCNAAKALVQLGRTDKATQLISKAEVLIKSHHMPKAQALIRFVEIMRAVLLGQLAEAKTILHNCEQMAIDAAWLGPTLAGWGTLVGVLLDDAILLDRYFHPEIAQTANLLHVNAAMAIRLRNVRRQEEADAMLWSGLERTEGARTPFFLYLAIAESDDAVLRARGRTDLRRLAALDQDVVFKATLPLFDAIVSVKSGDLEKAKRSARLAASRFQKLRYPLWEAQALEIGGQEEDAAAIYCRIGAASALRRLAVPARQSTSDRREVRAPATLSTRELEVAQLVAKGDTNAEVARTMCISVKAVEKHLSSVYGKLGLSSRGKLAAYLHEREPN